jgi:hypothetical protein
VTISIEPMPEGTVCVWCWKEITNDQASLEVGKGAVAHLGCDNRMLKFIDSLKGYIND